MTKANGRSSHKSGMFMAIVAFPVVALLLIVDRTSDFHATLYFKYVGKTYESVKNSSRKHFLIS